MNKYIKNILMFFFIFLIFFTPFNFCTADEKEKIEPHLIEKIFNVLYQKHTDEIIIKENDIKTLLNDLKTYEKKNPNEERSILFLRAECYYRLKDYKNAYVTFSHLKIKIKSKSDPLYATVDNRLNDMRKEIKLSKVKDDDQYSPDRLSISLIIGLIFLCIFIYIIDNKYRKKYSFDKRVYGIEIVPKNQLIKLEEMQKQDGRCSMLAINKYSKLNMKNWEALTETKKERLKNARLIVEGHRMIQRVNKLVPYPIQLISKIPKIGTWSPYWQYTFVGFIFIAPWFLIKNNTKLSTLISDITFFLIVAFVISCLTGIRIMAAKTINSIDEIISMLEPDNAEKSISKIEIWIERLLRSPRQYYFFVPIMIILVLILDANDKLFLPFGENSEVKFINIDFVFSTILVLISSTLTWFMIGSIITMNKIYNLKDLSMNPLSPSKTMGLEKWISVIGTYNIVCSMVLSLGCSIAVYEAYMADQDTAYAYFWFFIITPMLVFFWIYPYQKIGKIVKTKKIKRMNFVKIKIAHLFNEWIKSENTILHNFEKLKEMKTEDIKIISDIENEKKRIFTNLGDMERYYKVFKEIEESPESYFDINSALELARVMGLPSLFAIISSLIFHFK